MFTYIPVDEPRNPSEAASMSPEDSRLLLAQRNEKGARELLGESLCILGRFEEALLIITDPTKKAWIESLKKAEAEPDDARCGCTHTVDHADYTRTLSAKPILQPSRNYLGQFSFWSPKYGRVVKAQQCFKCGHMNAVPFEIVPEG